MAFSFGNSGKGAQRMRAMRTRHHHLREHCVWLGQPEIGQLPQELGKNTECVAIQNLSTAGFQQLRLTRAPERTVQNHQYLFGGVIAQRFAGRKRLIMGWHAL